MLVRRVLLVVGITGAALAGTLVVIPQPWWANRPDIAVQYKDVSISHWELGRMVDGQFDKDADLIVWPSSIRPDDQGPVEPGMLFQARAYLNIKADTVPPERTDTLLYSVDCAGDYVDNVPVTGTVISNDGKTAVIGLATRVMLVRDKTLAGQGKTESWLYVPDGGSVTFVPPQH